VQPRADNCEGFPPESFDFVLLDAPCSGLGLRPRLLISQTMPQLRAAARYGRALLDAAVQLMRPGGALVFSTCTMNPEENEANVRYVLDKYPCMRLVPQAPRLGGPGLTGSVPTADGGRRELLTETEAALVQRFDPAAEMDTIGFFIAKFEKQRV
jgi:16S rRNA C967 or C1407 C5-methylase (RsmB/RsmF family)